MCYNELFSNEDYKILNQLVEKRIGILRENKEFNKKYVELTNKIDNLEIKLANEEMKNEFNEIIKLFYETEEYYNALAFSLGIKYGNDLSKI